jgi:flagellar L-ring protein precursor FlgH
MGKNIMKKIIGITLAMMIIQTVQVSAQHSLYRDVKANKVGDIITIILAENISGSSTSDSRTTSNSDGRVSGAMSGNFLPFEPTFGSNVQVNYGSDERNLANQRQLLQGYMSVEIVEVTPAGILRVQGSRRTVINGEVHEMSLDGFVRTSDVDNRNRVYSYRMANADISYEKQEGLKNLTKKRGFFKRALFTTIGIAVTTVAVLKGLE